MKILVVRLPLLIACLLLLACSSGPKLSGFGLGDSRVVSVGEVVELRLPMAPGGGREWRVTSYDSLYLTLAGAPQPVRKSDGSLEMLLRARARTPGKTTLEVTEVGARDHTPRVVTYNIRIVQ